MRKLIIDGNEIEVPADYSVLQACEEAGAEIPRFCFHERLSVAGNCRMCLIEAKGTTKPIASCAYGVKDLRGGPNGEPPEILTSSTMVKKAREGVMEFLLINHPLDCPICDQGGECDLQDQAMFYGVDSSRFDENKRAVEDKYIGPLVKTVMTRCIHCTRCVRFTTEVAGVTDLGATGRGENVEITTYLESAMSSEMQGNVIDLCPVGALTSRPYAFKARPWELNRTETIDVMDAMGCNIRVDSRGSEVLRILPRVNDLVNEEWISDRTRFHFDGLKTQRLDKPYVRENGKLRPASWSEALNVVANKVKSSSKDQIGAILGSFVNVEEAYAIKKLFDLIGSSCVESRLDGSTLSLKDAIGAHVFNDGLMAIEDADALLIIGSNPRLEATVFNSRIRKRWRMGEFPIGLIGEADDLTYDYDHLGNDKSILTEILSGKNDFADVLKKADNPMIIIGADALSDSDARDILSVIIQIAEASGALREDWCGVNILQKNASRIGSLLMGAESEGGIQKIYKDSQSGEMKLIFNFGADDLDLAPFSECFNIYIGTHGDNGAHKADVILPGAAYTEKNGTYINTEGRIQFAQRAVFPIGDAREDWSIIRALAPMIGVNLGFDNFEMLRQSLYSDYPEMLQQNLVISGGIAQLKALKAAKECGKTPFKDASHSNYFLENPILRSSKIMAELAALRSEFSVAAE